MTKQSPPKRGEIWHLDFGPKKTEEYAGKHYAVCLAEKSSIACCIKYRTF